MDVPEAGIKLPGFELGSCGGLCEEVPTKRIPPATERPVPGQGVIRRDEGAGVRIHTLGLCAGGRDRRKIPECQVRSDLQPLPLFCSRSPRSSRKGIGWY